MKAMLTSIKEFHQTKSAHYADSQNECGELRAFLNVTIRNQMIYVR